MKGLFMLALAIGATGLYGGDARSQPSCSRVGIGVWTVLLNPDKRDSLYAGTSCGVFMSSDGAQTWRAAGLAGEGVTVLAADEANPRRMLAATTRSGVYRTADGGRTWHRAGLRGMRVLSLAFDPSRSAAMYAGTSVGAYKSTTDGKTWGRVGASLPRDYAKRVLVDPDNPTIVYAALGSQSRDRVFVSLDHGGTWRRGDHGLPTTFIGSLELNPNEPVAVYAGTHEGIFKSTDRGASWQVVNTDFMAGDRRADALAFAYGRRGGSGIFAQTYCSGVFKSTDFGRTWTRASDGIGPGCRPPFRIVINQHNSKILYALTPEEGLHRSGDGAQTWRITRQPR